MTSLHMVHTTPAPPPHDWFSPLDDDSRNTDYHIPFTEAGYSLVEE